METSFWSAVRHLGAIFACAIVVYTTCESIRVNGKVDYCYVSATHSEYRGLTTYALKGHRPWRIDLDITGPLRSFDETINAAKAYGCELK